MTRRIAIIIGSKSDLSQCDDGLTFLIDRTDEVWVERVYVRSQHRNMEEVKQLLEKLVEEKINAVIVGAGWANHLTGCCEAYLRYNLRSTGFPVIGVAFDDPKDERHTQAAILSITEVPGTKVVYADDGGLFVGSSGFLRACKFATHGTLPAINLPEPKPIMDLSLREAFVLSQRKD